MIERSILHIDSEKGWGGGQKQLLYLLKGLQKAGLRSLVVCRPESEVYRRCHESKIPIAPVKIWGELDFCAAWKIARLVRNNTFDIIHAHNAHAHATALLTRMFLK